ncbi:MAG: hypothetical protein BroJett015_10300 [Chloroflexota bacterium]|nr:MAG: hypothetical protein BroJett015_10300 [Chloroflexota bacterium]
MLIFSLAGLGLYWGWRTLWFLTDDAYIAFRYVSNSQLGFGYTWNPPPFRPVEGYTSFLWVALLDGIWRLTGVEPPVAANAVAFVFALGTTALGVAMLLLMPLRPALQKIRLPLLVLVLLAVLSNRTYLAWASSGLETAMFNFFVTAWVFCGLFLPQKTMRWLLLLVVTAVFIILSRPDGLLFVAATLILALLTFAEQVKDKRFQARALLTLTPLLIVVVHFLWRKQKYGEWLPNTYAAKYVAAWPESGLRYLFSFVVEYALWFWLILAILFLFQALRTRRAHWQAVADVKTFIFSRFVIDSVIVGTVLAHFAYYTLIIGGDHFEYRVYSQLVLLIFVSAVWLLNRLEFHAVGALVYLGLFILASWPIPWVHWQETNRVHQQDEEFFIHIPIAHRFPVWIRPYMQTFDDVQAWLIDHEVGVRVQEHALFHVYQLQLFPARELGLRLDEDTYPIIVSGGVGVPGWVLPTTAIIDTHGLNDYVIARNPVVLDEERRMAHDRYPPAGYVDCFEPGLQLVGDEKIVVAHQNVDAAQIKRCERISWPPSEGDGKSTSYLPITPDSAPAVHDYLWNNWPADPLYFYFVPPDETSPQPVGALIAAFVAYEGLGCLVLPPHQPAAGNEFLFAFFPDAGRPSLAGLLDDFPWMDFVAEEWDAGRPYHLGYAALMAPAIEAQPQFSQAADWGGQIQLRGYDLHTAVFQPGQTIHLTLYYQTGGAVDAGLTTYTHLVGTAFNPASGGPLWGQDDGEPCRSLYPMTAWPVGSTVIHKVAIPIPADAPPGVYQLNTGFYNWQTGVRLPLTDGAEGVSLTTIEVAPVE